MDAPDVASLTLARHPFKTLYYFSCSVASGTASAAHFVATHPVTIWVALPLLLLYTAAKSLALYPDATAAVDVSNLLSGCVRQCITSCSIQGKAQAAVSGSSCSRRYTCLVCFVHGVWLESMTAHL